MKEDFFESGAEMIVHGQTLDQIIFIVHGSVDLIVHDKFKNKHHLETIKQGGVIGMYSLHFNKEALFTAVARKQGVRILTLPQHFFIHNKYQIDGLAIALLQVETHVKQNGFPLCDFKTYDKEPLTAQ